ncbi:MAG: methyltransferase domain-containing protein [Terriglobales bacterium]
MPEQVIACPLSKGRLYRQPVEAIGRELADNGRLLNRLGAPLDTAIRTVLVREDGNRAYPIVDGVPILLAPEAVAPAAADLKFDLGAVQYAEAYSDMGHYNSVAAESRALDENVEDWQKLLAPVVALDPETRQRFPNPTARWCDAAYECVAQVAAYGQLVPLAGKRLLQLGGTGTHALKFLLAGAAEAWLITPMHTEAKLTQFWASRLGLQDRFHAVVGVGEELPFAAGSFSAIYSGGCLHHTALELAGAEAWRVLAPGGVFAAIDPWRAPLYRLGISIFGKRECNVHCRPLNPYRVRGFQSAFPGTAARRYGAIFRYPALALQKLGWSLPDPAVRTLMYVDEWMCRCVPPLRGLGSAVLLSARRPESARATTASGAGG